MQFISYLLYYGLLRIVSRIPFRVLYVLSDIFRFLIYNIGKYRVKVVRKNLLLVFPEKSEKELRKIEKEFYRHFFDTMMEITKSMSITSEQLNARFVYTNLEVLKKYEDNNQSVMLMMGHYGNWEWVMGLGEHIRHEGYGVYTPLRNKYLDNLIRKLRLRHNSYLISRYHTVRIMLRHKVEKKLAIYGLISDQSPQMRHAHHWTHFLGIMVPVYTGAEIMAKKFDAPVLFLRVERTTKRGHYEGTFEVITDNPKTVPNYQITDRYNELMEELIRRRPEYYLWTHNRFKHMDKVPDTYKDIPLEVTAN